ncbi:hypothetical protein [Chitinophaga eiseniae]|uniref:Uncharacterized protein n=1 Tax=Chitinophaga eiseniae TaxID=634771 RepID=A0A847SL86_9BACT|nr:hypothetical protein [Chitinophaga eiseniae]NLR78156.1 hypothetical protein [Chitinophaga eiseniae]
MTIRKHIRRYIPVPLAKAIDVIPGTRLVDINGINLKDLFREPCTPGYSD